MSQPPKDTITLFLCGDVMTGRGVDQILRHPGDPALYEPYLKDARDYVRLAEQASGPVPRRAPPTYPWGDALEELERFSPDARIINLETAITTSEAWWPKGINYRMHPANVDCLLAAGIDACVLGNNHVLDWEYEGLAETLETLRRAGIATAGAGSDLAEAAAPATLPIPGKGRVVLFSFGSWTAGVPPSWAAEESRPGVAMLDELAPRVVDRVAAWTAGQRRAGDVVVASLHWGPNWGYDVPPEQLAVAHALIEDAGVDVVHGHSSHHPKGIEVHRGRPILYGCGDFITDYEGIQGHEEYRGDLVLIYLVALDPARGELVELTMVPLRARRLRLQRASAEETMWLRDTLDRESRGLDSRVERRADGTLALRWG